MNQRLLAFLIVGGLAFWLVIVCALMSALTR